MLSNCMGAPSHCVCCMLPGDLVLRDTKSPGDLVSRGTIIIGGTKLPNHLESGGVDHVHMYMYMYPFRRDLVCDKYVYLHKVSY